MKPKNVYLVLCAAGIVIPYTQLVPWLFEHGLNMRLLIEQLFSNRIGAFFGLDVLVSAVVVFAFAGFERGRLGSRWWLPVAAIAPLERCPPKDPRLSRKPQSPRGTKRG